MKALGMICGVGSMMIGAKRQGYEIIGNIEWRPYYHTGTFQYNFPGSFMIKTLKDLTPEQKEKCQDLDLIIGHTECGGFSNLRVNKRDFIESGSKGDIPQFIEAIQNLNPKFFVMDNLPKSLIVADWGYWAENLPGYDIHFEWIGNYNYGNIQKNRNRLFIIGSKKDLGFYFIPGEFNHSETIKSRILGLSEESENHDLLDLDKPYGSWRKYMFDSAYNGLSIDENRMTLRELMGVLRDYPLNKNIEYMNQKGESKFRIGHSVVDIQRFAPTLSGGGSAFDNHFKSDTLYPFTIRERARIQGCPDDFEFFPKGVKHTCQEYLSLIKQTGKFMPVEFCTFITGQIKSFLEGDKDREFLYSEERKIKPNPYIDRNKFDYCTIIGYSNQEKVCEFCGSKIYCQSEKK